MINKLAFVSVRNSALADYNYTHWLPKPEPCPPLKSLLTAAVKSANSYSGSVIWRVGVVDLVVLA